MTACEFGDHLAYDVVEVVAGLGVGQQCRIFLLYCVPVDSVHVLKIEAVAECTPCFIEYLRPLLGIVYRSYHVAQVDALAELDI